MLLPEGPVFTRDQAVYVMHVPALGYFKVGRSKDVGARVRQVQGGCPERIELLGASQIDSSGIAAELFEGAMHDALSTFRSRGEWFSGLTYDQIVAHWQRVWNGLIERKEHALQQEPKSPAAAHPTRGRQLLPSAAADEAEPQPKVDAGKDVSGRARRKPVDPAGAVTNPEAKATRGKAARLGSQEAPVRPAVSAPADRVVSRLRTGRTVQDAGASSDAAGVAIPKRGRPRITEQRPWEAEGISRRTWYRRRGGPKP